MFLWVCGVGFVLPEDIPDEVVSFRQIKELVVSPSSKKCLYGSVMQVFVRDDDEELQ